MNVLILDKIIQSKLERLHYSKEQKPLNILLAEIPSIPNHREFTSALVVPNAVSIIAEIKRASPSKGMIREEFDHVEIAKDYEEGKVNAISVLTEMDYFLGDNQYLTDAKKITTRPILRKDFIIDDYQIYESKVIGADAILLIVSILTKEQLFSFINIATRLGLECLVEVHDVEELEIALDCGAKIIGVNNRNLHTFDINLKNTETIMRKIPKEIIVVSESGISSKEDLNYLKDLGVHAALIGESLMKASSIKEKLQELGAV